MTRKTNAKLQLFAFAAAALGLAACQGEFDTAYDYSGAYAQPLYAYGATPPLTTSAGSDVVQSNLARTYSLTQRY